MCAQEFVHEVLDMIKLDGIKDAIVGIPGVSGLSTEQRKRLTIAEELVSNPSIIFLDEPTSGLDAWAAAIVMRTVKNIADTGRTIFVCTIHQPSIDIFESFDEVVRQFIWYFKLNMWHCISKTMLMNRIPFFQLITMKTWGRLIYAGPLGRNSSRVIEYFWGMYADVISTSNCWILYLDLIMIQKWLRSFQYNINVELNWYNNHLHKICIWTIFTVPLFSPIFSILLYILY